MKYDVIVIGCGMSGILAGIHLKNSGKKFIILEKAGTLGGTWRDNTYPGLTCDVPSHAYTYSFEPNPEWSRVLPPGAEIQQYFEGVFKKYGIADFSQFGTALLHKSEGRRDYPSPALLHKSEGRRDYPSPRRSYAMAPTGTVLGRPSCVKRLSRATRTCNSTTCRSNVRAITRWPRRLKQCILVSTRLLR